MRRLLPKLSVALGLGIALSVGVGEPIKAQTPKKGGILNFVVASRIPSYDGHKEGTFGMVHPIAPFYSLLIRVDPENPSSPTAFVCDLCVGDIPKPTNDGKTYTFKVRKGVKFHDGTPFSAADVKATYDKIIFPPEGVRSNRKTFYSMVESVTAPDAETVVFNLKFATGTFIPALATPFNFIYSKKDLDEKGYDWHEKNINGTGPFIFVQHQAGSFVEGRRNPNYHFKGQPYLDGFKAIAAPKMAVRIQAIRGDRAAIEFRGFPPKARDDLVKALGDKITVQEGDWNCALYFTPNHQVKPFDDPRVRRAMTLAVDRWGGSKYLSRIAIMKTPGGVVYPNHPLAASKEELEKIPGFWPDIKKSRAEARRLLKEAGAENLTFDLINRSVDQPYKIVGTWLIDQWKQVGIKATQRVVATAEWVNSQRKGSYQVITDANCQSVVNPIVDVSKWLGDAGNNYGQYKGGDPELQEMYSKMEREGDMTKVRSIMRKFEMRAMGEMAHMGATLWWYKINPHRSYVKGWKIAPSHYLNQQLDNVWLDK